MKKRWFRSVAAIVLVLFATLIWRGFAAKKARMIKEAKRQAASWMGATAGGLKKLTINGIEYRFHWAPPCSEGFLMGSPPEERIDDETQHRVKLSRGFWVLETEVTQSMQESVTGNNLSNNKGPNLPAENVSWKDCQDFIKRANKSGAIPYGWRMSLPTEAQWEYACRAGTSGAYNGTGGLDALGWYYHNSGYESGYETHTVGEKGANAWGLRDMHGNVYEWCEDWYGYYPSGTVINPTGPNDEGSDRVLRGGCMSSGPENCRSAARYAASPTLRLYYFGFRPVLVSSDK